MGAPWCRCKLAGPSSPAPVNHHTIFGTKCKGIVNPVVQCLAVPALSKVHLVNPSDVSFGTAVITPRWLYVLAAATPTCFGDPVIVDETLEQIDPASIQHGDVVGIGVHTANALRGYAIGKMARERGAYVVFGGIHATLYPEEAIELGGAHAVVQGDGDQVWPTVLADCRSGAPKQTYAGGRSRPVNFLPRAGTCFRATGTCGRQCKRFAAVRSTVHSVRSGAPTASGLASVAPMLSSRRLSSCAGWVFGSSHLPTTISIR